MQNKGKLFIKSSINTTKIECLVKSNWNHIGLNLSEITLLKASQNHTFKVSVNNSSKYILRVTPDPDNIQKDRILEELSFLDYLVESGLSVCSYVATEKGEKFIRDEIDGALVVVFEWAKGSPLNPLGSEYMNNKQLWIDWGNWLGKLHNLSRKFSKINPEISKRIRNWTELHDSVMKGHPIDPEDLKSSTDPNQYGIIHGDVNSGNLYYDENNSTIWVFDWDQIQRSWFLHDIAQSICGPWMLSATGNPFTGEPIQCNIQNLMDWITEGYEKVSETGKVDRTALKRMIMLRRDFYEKFCRRAVVELEGDEELKGMRNFCEYAVKWAESNPQI